MRQVEVQDLVLGYQHWEILGGPGLRLYEGLAEAEWPEVPWRVLETLLRPMSSHGLTLWHSLHLCAAHLDLISLGSKG